MKNLYYLKAILHNNLAVSISDADILFKHLKKEIIKKNVLDFTISLSGIEKLSYTFLKQFVKYIILEYNETFLKTHIHFIDYKDEWEYLYDKAVKRVCMLKRQGRLRADFKKFYYKF